MSDTFKSNMKQFGHSILFPQTVRTNQCDGLLHLLAMFFMWIDHSGKMLYGNMPLMRIWGRLAFPMFAYCIAVGVIYTHDSTRYLSRVVLIALISQPLNALGLAHENPAMYSVPFATNPLLSILTFYINSWQSPSILLSLSLALGILIALRDKNFILAIGLYVLCERFSSVFDYGIHGIRLILIFYFFVEHPPLAALASSIYLLWWSHSTGKAYTFFGQTFSMEVFALPAVLFCALPIPRLFKLPKWLTYTFYPAHLVLLIILTKKFSLF